MPTLISLLLLMVVAIGVWLIWRRSRRRFVIHIEDGKISRSVGRVPDDYLIDVDRICEFWKIERGRVIGRRTNGRRIRITAGRGIDRQHRQAFQNAWNYPV